MKKIILSIALISGVISLASIQATTIGGGEEVFHITTAVFEDDGFVDVKFEELNEKVQAAVQEIIRDYEVKALKYNAAKKITKIEAAKRDDQSSKVFLLDDEGKEVACESAPVEGAQKTEERREAPWVELSGISQDDGFADVKFEELNEKVQNAVRAIAEKYDLRALQYNATKKVTKVKGTSKEDQAEKTFYLDEEGREINQEVSPEAKSETEVEKRETGNEVPAV